MMREARVRPKMAVVCMKVPLTPAGAAAGGGVGFGGWCRYMFREGGG